MNDTIWKYPLTLTDRQTVMMPEGAVILTAQIQNGSGLCVWALVDSAAEQQPREIEIFGTGHPASDANRRYVSTVQMQGGALVWHVFEREQA